MTTPEPADRLEQLRHAFDDHAGQVAALRERAAAIASRTVTGEAAQGQVVVTVIGQGAIQEVRVSQRALRETDNMTLARHVMTAVNDALEQVDRLVAELRPAPATDVDATLDRYERRMDQLLDRLNTIDRDLDRLER
jgi:DNA-binding protein YbaB